MSLASVSPLPVELLLPAPAARTHTSATLPVYVWPVSRNSHALPLTSDSLYYGTTVIYDCLYNFIFKYLCLFVSSNKKSNLCASNQQTTSSKVLTMPCQQGIDKRKENKKSKIILTDTSRGANTIGINRTIKWMFGYFPENPVWRLTRLFFLS